MRSHFTLIGVPFDLGGTVKGSRFAPDKLRDLGIIQSIRNTIDHLTDLGNIQIHADDSMVQNEQGINHLQSVINCNQAIIHCRKQLDRNILPVILGGDHSIGYGSVLSSLEQHSKLGLIWFDAHGDMNTETTSLTHNAHGMPTAGLMGLLKSPIQKISDLRINPQHIFWIGTRALDEGERYLVDKYHLHVYTTGYIQQQGMSRVMASINEIIKEEGIENIHVSFDVDALDPSIVPATGVPEKNGLLQDDLSLFIQSLPLMAAPVSCLDFVEYNPEMDDADYSTGKWCIQTITDLMKAINIQHNK